VSAQVREEDRDPDQRLGQMTDAADELHFGLVGDRVVPAQQDLGG